MAGNDKKTIVLNLPEFLAAVHNFRKSEVGDLILYLCEKNLYGHSRLKLNERVLEKFTFLQNIVDEYTRRYNAIRENRKKSGSKGGSKSQAKSKQILSEESITDQNFMGRSIYDQDLDNEKFKNKFLVGGACNLHNSDSVADSKQEKSQKRSGYLCSIPIGKVVNNILSKIKEDENEDNKL